MKNIKIEIVTESSGALLENIFEQNVSKITSGNRTKEILDGATIGLSDDYIPKESFGLYEIINFTLTFSSGVAAGLVANWLYGKLNKDDKVVYRGCNLKIEEFNQLIIYITKSAKEEK